MCRSDSSASVSVLNGTLKGLIKLHQRSSDHPSDSSHLEGNRNSSALPAADGQKCCLNGAAQAGVGPDRMKSSSCSMREGSESHLGLAWTSSCCFHLTVQFCVLTYNDPELQRHTHTGYLRSALQLWRPSFSMLLSEI